MARPLLMGTGMKLASLATCLLSLLPLATAACTEEVDDSEANLPGDIDNNGGGTGGKGDAWDGANDPARFANSLNYRLAELPKVGKLDKPVWKDRYPQAVGKAPMAWADTYWPSYELSTNVRWQNRTTKSPLEKYDAAFNNAPGCAAQPDTTCGPTAKAKWDQYFTCAGPAAKWHMKNFQNINQMFDGINNDSKGGVDDCSSSDDEGPQGWWGLCHAWTPASLLEPEPQHAVTYAGQTWEVADIKALIITLYDRTDSIMLGGRCNAQTIEHNGTVSGNETCQDVNPGALHVVLTNFIGINDLPVIEDRTASSEVWNQPLVGYRVTKQAPITIAKALTCVGGTGTKWTYNTSAKSLVEVELETDYLTEGSASTRPLGMDDYVSHDQYHYILELGSTGKIIGGRYCTDSATDHPDFLWTAKGVSTSSYGRNPNVALDKVRTLINLSITPPGTGGGTGERTYQATTPVAIPDNAPAGVSIDLTVPDTFAFTSLSVSVDVKHTWRGDLLVELLHDGNKVATLVDRTGGSADDLVQTFPVTTATAGTAGKGKWTVRFVDTAADDTGTVQSVKLAFATN